MQNMRSVVVGSDLVTLVRNARDGRPYMLQSAMPIPPSPVTARNMLCAQVRGLDAAFGHVCGEIVTNTVCTR